MGSALWKPVYQGQPVSSKNDVKTNIDIAIARGTIHLNPEGVEFSLPLDPDDIILQALPGPRQLLLNEIHPDDLNAGLFAFSELSSGHANQSFTVSSLARHSDFGSSLPRISPNFSEQYKESGSFHGFRYVRVTFPWHLTQGTSDTVCLPAQSGHFITPAPILFCPYISKSLTTSALDIGSIRCGVCSIQRRWNFLLALAYWARKHFYIFFMWPPSFYPSFLIL